MDEYSDPESEKKAAHEDEAAESLIYQFPDCKVSTSEENEIVRRSQNNLLATEQEEVEEEEMSAKSGVKAKVDLGLQSINRLIISVVGQPRGQLVVKTTPITDDYVISSNVLGLGISGKVVECSRKPQSNNDNNSNANPQAKYALKILKDNLKSRREIDLHWKASSCVHIVNIHDVYENTYNGHKCLLVVMEW